MIDNIADFRNVLLASTSLYAVGGKEIWNHINWNS